MASHGSVRNCATWENSTLAGEQYKKIMAELLPEEEPAAIREFIRWLVEANEPSKEVAAQMLWTLANYGKVNREVIIKSGGIPILVNCLQSPNAIVQEGAVGALTALAANKKDNIDIIQAAPDWRSWIIIWKGLFNSPEPVVQAHAQKLWAHTFEHLKISGSETDSAGLNALKDLKRRRDLPKASDTADAATVPERKKVRFADDGATSDAFSPAALEMVLPSLNVLRQISVCSPSHEAVSSQG